LKLWFKFPGVPVTPNGQQLVQSLQPTTVPEDLPQAEFQAGIQQVGTGRSGWRVSVVEQHDQGSNLFTARVQSRPLPDRISHRYYVGLGEVRHDFDYDEMPAPTVVITSREKVLQTAIDVPNVIVQVRE
ncbi:MAG: hypothetical protein AB7F89_06935, partial [Pirellulaceae bacterium]